MKTHTEDTLRLTAGYTGIRLILLLIGGLPFGESIIFTLGYLNTGEDFQSMIIFLSVLLFLLLLTFSAPIWSDRLCRFLMGEVFLTKDHIIFRRRKLEIIVKLQGSNIDYGGGIMSAFFCGHASSCCLCVESPLENMTINCPPKKSKRYYRNYVANGHANLRVTITKKQYKQVKKFILDNDCDVNKIE